ncbi:MAG: chromosome condensation regulator RCC1 [Chloroflexi bacterium]|nr:chromosome condensation regulator RCC1 [Chloroflexota bacterium]
MTSIGGGIMRLLRLRSIALWLTVVAAVSLVADAAPAEGADGVASLALGGSHSCVLRADGSAACWGWNFYGQLGNGTAESSLAPAEVCGGEPAAGCLPLAGVVALAGGENHTCAVTEERGVICWGRNEHGQLGDGTKVDRELPVDVCRPLTNEPVPARCAPLAGIVAIAAGSSHSCAVTDAGGVLCWGGNARGQLGSGTMVERSWAVAVCAAQGEPAGGCEPLTGVAAIAAGNEHTCALMAAGDVRCWGDNVSGALGDGGDCGEVCPRPVAVCAADAAESSCEPLAGVTAVSGGGRHSCALVGDGRVVCWGDNAQGQLGEGAMVDAVAVAAGIGHTCAIDTAGGVVCWGANFVSQLGDGTTRASPLPVQVAGLESGVTGLAAGGSHSCALRSEGGVRCWGWNGDGRLGDGTFAERRTPVKVVGLGDKVAATPTPVPDTVAGDVDCDGLVDAIDAALVLQFEAGLLATLSCAAAADVNGDGLVDAIDAALVLQFEAGLIESL